MVFLVPLLFLPATRSTKTTWSSGATVPHAGIFASIRDGFVVIRSNRSVAFSLISQTVLFVSLGALWVVGLARIQSVLPAGKTFHLSIVASSGTIGLLAGAAAASLGKRMAANRLVGICALGIAIAWVGLARSASLPALSAWTLVLGLATSPVFIVTETLLQSDTPVTYRGRVFSGREVWTKFGFLIGSSLATLADAIVTREFVMIAVGVLLAVLGVVLERKNFLRV